jgi:putative membrane protein
MQRASEFLNPDQRRQIEQAVTNAESTTSCEIVPAVATRSARYERSADIVGLWFAVAIAMVIWWFFPRAVNEPGNWGGSPTAVVLISMGLCMAVAFLIGTTVAGRVGWLLRLFTPRKQMRSAVDVRAREVFFDKRVHHTKAASGVLIYISLFERVAVVLGDALVLETMGQPFLDQLCGQLTDCLRRDDAADGISRLIAEAGTQLSGPLPRAKDDSNEIQDTLILFD